MNPDFVSNSIAFKDWLREKGLTQEHLAHQMGVQGSDISYVIRSQKRGFDFGRFRLRIRLQEITRIPLGVDEEELKQIDEVSAMIGVDLVFATLEEIKRAARGAGLVDLPIYGSPVVGFRILGHLLKNFFPKSEVLAADHYRIAWLPEPSRQAPSEKAFEDYFDRRAPRTGEPFESMARLNQIINEGANKARQCIPQISMAAIISDATRPTPKPKAAAPKKREAVKGSKGSEGK